ncbi:TasA family protein [Sporosarcina sp. FSL K6-2383]|uniref:TasA family protein n=1 Tax=Sporosarcina sp. FSL K6-2383 TaxID=2921556 RepID=UPI00315A7A85
MTSVFADVENDAAETDLEISLSPKDTLFDITNMKPGDWAPRTITVQNSGSKDFVYHMQLQNSGEVKLFNELLLEIKVGDIELYTGKLAALKSLPERKLTSGTEENLNITIRFPEHLGNDFQGLESAFVFAFTAEGKDNAAAQAMTKVQIDSGVLATTGFGLPGKSSNIVTLMFLGSILVTGGIVLLIIRRYRRVSRFLN